MQIITKADLEALSKLIDLLDSNQDLFLDGHIDIPGDYRIERFRDGTWGIDLFNRTVYDMPKAVEAPETPSVNKLYGDGMNC